ncbi:hypothetical protein KSP40_PGU012402 [Platanthera guangdongensis]|uniref:Uncharacterized protein n=1 Tax=Platanthera guangdongensis TaxID=2320717 RepID=A0ABR2MIC7_9ASPA
MEERLFFLIRELPSVKNDHTLPREPLSLVKEAAPSRRTADELLLIEKVLILENRKSRTHTGNQLQVRGRTQTLPEIEQEPGIAASRRNAEKRTGIGRKNSGGKSNGKICRRLGNRTGRFADGERSTGYGKNRRKSQENHLVSEEIARVYHDDPQKTPAEWKSFKNN